MDISSRMVPRLSEREPGGTIVRPERAEMYFDCIRRRPLSRIFQKIRLAVPYFRLISGSVEFLRKLWNSAENTPEHHKFGQQDRQIETFKA